MIEHMSETRNGRDKRLALRVLVKAMIYLAIFSLALLFFGSLAPPVR